MQTALKLRPAHVGDLVSITALERQLFGDLSYPYAAFRQLLDAYGANVHVAEAGDDFVGYAVAILAEDTTTGWLWSMGVQPDHRRKGVGRSILHRVVDQLASIGAARVRLTVDPANHAALALYDSFGFARSEFAKDYFGAGEDRFIMEYTV